MLALLDSGPWLYLAIGVLLVGLAVADRFVVQR